jgi:hypothetical protein
VYHPAYPLVDCRYSCLSHPHRTDSFPYFFFPAVSVYHDRRSESVSGHLHAIYFEDLTNQCSGPIASSTAWLPLLYDTVVITLTLKRTVSYMGPSNPGHIFRVLLHEGLLYYRSVCTRSTYDLLSLNKPGNSVICTITLTFTIMIVSATQSIRNVTGQYVFTHISVYSSFMSPLIVVAYPNRVELWYASSSFLGLTPPLTQHILRYSASPWQ